jgi:hypothetical protein
VGNAGQDTSSRHPMTAACHWPTLSPQAGTRRAPTRATSTMPAPIASQWIGRHGQSQTTHCSVTTPDKLKERPSPPHRQSRSGGSPPTLCATVGGGTANVAVSPPHPSRSLLGAACIDETWAAFFIDLPLRWTDGRRVRAALCNSFPNFYDPAS